VNTLHVLNQIDDNQLYPAFPLHTFPPMLIYSSRFKSPPQFAHFTPASHPTVHNTTDLGLFASAVLDHTTSNFRCILTASTTESNDIDPTPSTPSVTASPSLERRPAPNEPQTPFSIPIPFYDANMRPLSSTSLPPRSPKRQSFAVEIVQRPMQPTPSSSIASSTYKSKKATTAAHPHQRRISTSPTPTHNLAEKDRVEAMVSQFSILLEDIFEAEDAFNPEAEEPTEGSLAFFATDSLRDERPWLSTQMHRKLDVHLRKLARTVVGRHGGGDSGLRIDTGDLARITGMCERAVKAAEMVELKELGDEDDPEREWMMNRLGRVENAVLAANVIMLLIMGSGTDQQVTSPPPVHHSRRDRLLTETDILGGNVKSDCGGYSYLLGFFISLDCGGVFRQYVIRYSFGRHVLHQTNLRAPPKLHHPSFAIRNSTCRNSFPRKHHQRPPIPRR